MGRQPTTTATERRNQARQIRGSGTGAAVVKRELRELLDRLVEPYTRLLAPDRIAAIQARRHDAAVVWESKLYGTRRKGELVHFGGARGRACTGASAYAAQFARHCGI